ncbi:hypothetical protein LCGC14_1777980, partial [marine sediment metagenome]
MLNEPFRVLNGEQMGRIHEAALTILADVGMKIDSPKALGHLRSVGCEVDEAQRIVRFPRALVQGCVDKMRRDYDDPGRVPEGMAVRYSHIRFRRGDHRIHPDFAVSAGGFSCFIHDLDGHRRPATMDDVHRSINLVNQLDEITYTGLPVSDQATAPSIRPVAMAAELAKYTTKLGGVETFKPEDIPYLI